ncbi:MAG: YesL family protein [Atopobiaceae bacterium]|nr:YesL family protein [Atopobiaceae bacterium]
MSIFSYESKFSRVFLRIADACFLNILWFVCSLPIFTIGASTTALYSVTLKIAENREGNVRKQFFEAFKREFKQATVLWLILLAIGIVLFGDIYVLRHLLNTSSGPFAIMLTIILAIIIAACIVYTVEVMYVFPLLSRVANTNRAMMINSLLIGLRYLACTISVFAIHFVMGVIAIRFFTPILVLGEGLCALLSSYLMAPVFRTVTALQERSDAEQAAQQTTTAESDNDAEDRS